MSSSRPRLRNASRERSGSLAASASLAGLAAVAAEAGADAAASTKVLSVRQLAWRKFRKNKLAVFGLVVLVVMYLGAAFAGFLAPYGDRETHAQFARYPRLHGNHGYEPTEPTMKAIFVAHGPAFRSGWNASTDRGISSFCGRGSEDESGWRGNSR